MDGKKKIVTNCHECPFCNYDNEYGRDICNMNPEVSADDFMELPADKVHDLCPLKEGEITISL